MDISDAVGQHRIHVISVGRWAVSPLVEPGPRHLEDPAGHRDGKPVYGQFVDQPEPYFGRMFSRAKYALARFNISTSVSRRFLSRRN